MAIIDCPNCGTKNRVDESAARQMQPVCGKCGAVLDVTSAAAAADSTKPITVTDATFAREVLGARGVPILVDYWAEWCSPCRMVAPVLDELAAESNGRYRIAKLNVDENPRTAAQYNIRSIPTMLVFRDGAVVDRIVGAQPKQAIAARLR
ncbi:MAG TPA: thioredoxin [Pyrinomonadaceae bacterium]|nr:thioredoxin [Pyrinomonadaceae bacterium]